MIACGERYTKAARISINSFLKYHDDKLSVIVNDDSLSDFKDRVNIIQIKQYVQAAIEEVGNHQFAVFKYDEDGNHNRLYSALKIIIMDKAITEGQYILSLDADTIFSGNILEKIKNYLRIARHRFDIYMVQRDDPRMMLVCNLEPGSGFTIWKRDCGFIKRFISEFKTKDAGLRGGSQTLINKIKIHFLYHEIDDPMLHFISPDLKNPNITDEEISKIRPAYIHLHGADSYSRLLRFNKIFDTIS
jgi:hypothetical protein